MSDIFLSYKSEDRAKARIIAKALESHGYSVWWDRIILPGQTFDEVIEEELAAANCIVVLWSKESVKSEWVRTEASEGKRRKILVPVSIEDVTLPLAFRYIQAAKLMDWNETSHHHEFELLIRSVERVLGRAALRPKQGEERTEEKKVTNSIGMKFTLIKAGEFMIGSEEFESSKPVHTVKIRTPFYLGIYQVTQREWKAIMENNPSYFKGDDLPVESVSWNEVQDFIKKLNEKESTNKYRLPAEAEWEYAARAGTTTRYSFGDDESELSKYAWYVENSGSRSPNKGDYFGYNKDDWFKNKWNGKTQPVGKKEANPWGLYDIHGNVWECVQDEWHDTYDGAPADDSAWEDGVSALRVYRGGSWLSFAGNCRSANRDHHDPGYRIHDLGFRLLQEI